MKKSFEESLKELEEIVKQLEKGNYLWTSPLKCFKKG